MFKNQCIEEGEWYKGKLTGRGRRIDNGICQGLFDQNDFVKGIKI